MKKCYFFYRSGHHCLLAQDERSDEWHGFVGMLANHPWHGCGFKKVKNIAIGKVPINNSLNTTNNIFKSLWYMGFCTHPYSREKTLEDLKRLVDNISDELKKDN